MIGRQLSLMTLSKNSELTICHANGGIFYKHGSAFYYVCTASWAGTAVTIVKAE